MSMSVDAQKDLLTKRWRKVKPPDLTELQLHIACVNYYQRMKVGHSVGEHSPNGEIRDKRTGAKLKAMGTLPGAADYTITRRCTWSIDCLPEVFKIEFKRKGGKQSEAQINYQRDITACGCEYIVIDDLDEWIKWLEMKRLVRTRQAAGRGEVSA